MTSRFRSRLPFGLHSFFVASLAVCSIGFAENKPSDAIPKITPDHANGIYAIGEKVTWAVDLTATSPGAPLHYKVTENNVKTLKEGTLPAGETSATLSATLDEPGWLYVVVGDEKAKTAGTGGAIVAPDQILPSAKAPDDFDAFWKSQIALIEKVPANAQLTPGDSEKPGVDYWEVTLDNVDGTHVRAQLARPKNGTRFPAIVLYQYAGVYPLPKTFVTGMAANGWLALNVMAHDLPLHEDKSFYANLKIDSKPATAYTTIGQTSRDTSYFRRMFLGDYQAIEWLRTRPDWNGKVLAVRGESQGGMQSFAMAGLNPHVTAAIAIVPAGGDTLGMTAGRSPGWPGWFRQGKDDAEKKAIMETSRYYDPLNFASRATCPVMMAAGMRDVTACPTAIIAAANTWGGPHDLVLMPNATHQGNHEPSTKRANEWYTTLKKTGSAPVQ